MHRTGFEPVHPEIVELKSTALNHSATDALVLYNKKTVPTGFEPVT